MSSNKGRIPWNKGKHHSEETKRKISTKNIGNKKMLGKTMPEEAKRMISEANKGRIPWNKGQRGVQEAWNKGIPHSDETKQKISDANRGKVRSEETRQRLSKAGMGNPSRTGQHASEETKDKMSEARTGEKNAMYGKHHSEETRHKIAVKAMGREASEETRRKMGESRTGEKNPAWNGGTTFFPYCHKFNGKLKDKIRARDEYQCQMPGCLCTQIESISLHGKRLSIHHVHYLKSDCEPDLIALCNTCNFRVNVNRDHYEALFMSKLKDRGLLIE